MAWIFPRRRRGGGAVPGKCSSQAGPGLGPAHKPHASWEPGACPLNSPLVRPKGLPGEKKTPERTQQHLPPCDPLPRGFRDPHPGWRQRTRPSPLAPPTSLCHRWRLERET